MKEKYFIHLLDTPVGKYIYDVNTNSIIETNDKYHYTYFFFGEL